MKQCLIGREVELKSLQQYINSERSEFVAVYGRRRVGKTFLIRHAAEEKFTFFMTGVYKASKSEQLTNFAISLQKYSGSDRLILPKNWILAFYELSKFIESLPEGKKIIFFYNFTGLTILPELKKKYKNVKACLLVTDLPEYMDANNYLLTRLNRKISNIFSSKDNKHFNHIDGYILLAPAMRERLPMENKPWIQIEGIYNPEDDKACVEKAEEKIVLYTGNLGKRYGILELLEAFHRINKNNYRLWICGTGDGLEDVKKYEDMDPRISYLGTLPRTEVIKLQKKVTILINPRHSTDEYTIYSFPSKTMEYLASGTPTLMSHLKSIPQEYDNHIFYFEDESIEGFSNRIVEICEKPSKELAEFGSKASLFIRQNKTPEPQVKKIISFLKNI